MIKNPIAAGSGTATIQVNLGQSQYPEHGIYYVSPDGTSSFKDLRIVPFSIQVKNKSFVLPVVEFDMDQGWLSGGLSVIQGTEGYSALTNARQYLSGDGAINGPT